jgi:hypothetical protein
MAGRALDANLAAALAADHVNSFLLIELGFDSGTQYLTSLPHDVDYAGHTWVSAQAVGTIEPVTETDAGAQGLAFTLSGVPVSAIAGALTEPVQGRPVNVALVVLDGTTLRVDPSVWTGRFDVMTIADQAAGPAIRVTAEHALIGWSQPSGLLFSDADQQRLHPGDKFFEYAAQMSQATVVWPDKSFFSR